MNWMIQEYTRWHLPDVLRMSKNMHGEETASSTNDSGKSRFRHAEKWKEVLNSHHAQNSIANG